MSLSDKDRKELIECAKALNSFPAWVIEHPPKSWIIDQRESNLLPPYLMKIEVLFQRIARQDTIAGQQLNEGYERLMAALTTLTTEKKHPIAAWDLLKPFLKVKPVIEIEKVKHEVDRLSALMLDIAKEPKQANPVRSTGGKTGKTTQQDWDDNDPDYMENSKAVTIFAQSKLPLPTLRKMLDRKNNTIRWMGQGHRCKVHIGDFKTWAEKEYLPDSVKGEIADEVLEYRKKQQEQKSYETFSKKNFPPNRRDNQ
jgi:hypothetical protein